MALIKTFEIINRLVAAKVIDRYAVAGAVAALNYIEPMLTHDVDILVSFESGAPSQSGLITLTPTVEHLRKLGYADLRNEGISVEDWPVQFLPVASDLDAEALMHAVEIEIVDSPGDTPI